MFRPFHILQNSLYAVSIIVTISKLNTCTWRWSCWLHGSVGANNIREDAISEKRTADTEEQKKVSSCITWWSLTVGRSVMTFPLFWFWLLAYRLLDWGTGPGAKIPLPDISFCLAKDPVFILNTRNTRVNHQGRHQCFLNPAYQCTCRQLLLLNNIFVQLLLLIKFVIIEARRAASVEHFVNMNTWMLNLQIRTYCASRYYNILDSWFWNSRSYLLGSSSAISSPKKTWLPMAFPWTEILGTSNFRNTSTNGVSHSSQEWAMIKLMTVSDCDSHHMSYGWAALVFDLHCSISVMSVWPAEQIMSRFTAWGSYMSTGCHVSFQQLLSTPTWRGVIWLSLRLFTFRWRVKI